VKRDLLYSKKGRAVALFSPARVMHLKFNEDEEIEDFFRMMNAIIHTHDNRPLYENGKFLLFQWLTQS
jgi:hypothetical protein